MPAGTLNAVEAPDTAKGRVVGAISEYHLHILHSKTAGKAPTSLQNGQIAVNQKDAFFYWPDDTGTVKHFDFVNPVSTPPAVNNNSTRLATTSWVMGQISNAVPQMNGVAAAGSSTHFSREDHVHPTDTAYAPAISPAFIIPTTNNPPVDSNTSAIPTTSWAMGQLGDFTPLGGMLGDPTAALSVPPRVSRIDHVHPVSLAYTNLALNSRMEVSQEFGTSLIFGNGWIDGWLLGVSLDALSGQQVSDGPSGFKNSFKITVTAAQNSFPANSYFLAQQTIEELKTRHLMWGTANASPITIGWWFKANRFGPWPISIRSSNYFRSYVSNFVVNNLNTWEYKTITIPGDAIGGVDAWNNSGLVVTFALASSFTHTSNVPNSWISNNLIALPDSINGTSTVGNYIQFTGVSVFPGNEVPDGLRLASLLRSYPEELRACQRYFYMGNPSLNGIVIPPSFVFRMSALHPVVMRAVPAVTMTSPTHVWDGTSVGVLSGIRTNYSTADVLELDFNASSFLIPARPALMYVEDSTFIPGTFKVNARI